MLGFKGARMRLLYLILGESVLHLEVKWLGGKRHDGPGELLAVDHDPAETITTTTTVWKKFNLPQTDKSRAQPCSGRALKGQYTSQPTGENSVDIFN